jgi:hypothetical protein
MGAEWRDSLPANAQSVTRYADETRSWNLFSKQLRYSARFHVVSAICQPTLENVVAGARKAMPTITFDVPEGALSALIQQQQLALLAKLAARTAPAGL